MRRGAPPLPRHPSPEVGGGVDRLARNERKGGRGRGLPPECTTVSPAGPLPPAPSPLVPRGEGENSLARHDFRSAVQAALHPSPEVGGGVDRLARNERKGGRGRGLPPERADHPPREGPFPPLRSFLAERGENCPLEMRPPERASACLATPPPKLGEGSTAPRGTSEQAGGGEGSRRSAPSSACVFFLLIPRLNFSRRKEIPRPPTRREETLHPARGMERADTTAGGAP
jgi:hypothetical protein